MNQLGKFNGALLVGSSDNILYEEDMRIIRENVEALTYFTREGGTFTVAISRTRPNFTSHTSRASISAPVILSNGSALCDFRTGEMIYETFLSDWAREDFQQMARTILTIGFEACHHDAIYVYQPNAITLRHLEWTDMITREVSIVDIPLLRSKVILQQDYETLLYTQRYLPERWGECYEVTFFNQVLLELTRKGSSKGGMVQYLARCPGIDTQHIYCVGDNQSDIPVLAVSVVPFAPVNCAPEAEQWGARILGAYEENCVARTVDTLDHIYA